MRVAVIGSRTFSDYEFLKETLQHVYITEMISGGALGADQLAERYAKEKNIPIRIIPHTENKDIPDLSRTYSIINLAQLVIAFWDGKSQGTCDLVKFAQKSGKQVSIKNFRVPS
jgi:YspA, cpYpsA-related SLOG family